jgi:4-amino-4-deoxy-L-arabinose transferase-like glycosyltransferase
MQVMNDRRLLITDPAVEVSRMSLPVWVSWLALTAIVALGAAVRLIRLDDLSLWLDEIYVVDYIRRPWRTVLGFDGAYDNHPPLYFAFVKAVSSLTGEASAARVVSALAGSLTIVVIFFLTRRLVNTNAGLLASLILALAPLHIWYSREGRMYAPAVLFVGLSWYALIRFLPGRDRRWGVIYGATLTLAAYTDYSAFYGLVPQALVVAWLSRESPWRIVRAWMVVVSGAALLFAPWAAQVLRSIQFVGDDRVFLAVTWQKVLDSFYSITGLPGERVYYWGVVSTPWVTWPEIRPVAVALVTLVLFLAVATLSGRYRSMLVLGSSLCFGTIAVTALASYLVSPGYADRTVSYAVLGWAMLAGAAPFGRVPNGMRPLALGAVALLLAGSVLALHGVAQDADKEHYRQLAVAAGEVNELGYPLLVVARPEHQVIADSTGLVRTAISLYEPEVQLGDIGAASHPPVFWDVATSYPWETEGLLDLRSSLEEQGFVLVQSDLFPPVMSLDLWVSADLVGDRRSSISTWASETAPVENAPGWWFEADSAFAGVGAEGDPQLLIYPLEDGDAAVEYRQIVAGAALYLVRLDYQIALPVGSGTVKLSCLDVEENALATSATVLAPPLGLDQTWHRGMAGIACPAGTTELVVSLVNSGFGDLRLRHLSLGVASPAQPGFILPPPWR